jgi:peptidoglycan/xylan/chitin deacetylase (PgdA/CDA1 family)
VTGRLRALALTGTLLVTLGAGALSRTLADEWSGDLEQEVLAEDGSEEASTGDLQPTYEVAVEAMLAYREEPPSPPAPPAPSQPASRTSRPPAPAPPITPGVVYLTFDDGPDPVVCGQILTILAREHIHATFFVVGQKVLRYPDVARRMAAEGHTIGNHSWDHSQLNALSYRGIVWQLTTTQEAVARVTGVRPTLFRPPYGATNGNVARAAGAAGLRTVMWSVDPRDWSQPGTGAITARVVGSSGPGSIILLHCLHPQTPAALPQIIAGLRARGFTFAAL